MINLYVDMDGVVADFDDFIKDFYPELPHKERFSKAVLEEQVFEILADQEGGTLLMETLDHLSYQLKDKITINFLTSVGTKDPDLGTIVSEQKQKWLTNHGYTYKPLFVTEKKFKAKYAHEKAILMGSIPESVLRPSMKKSLQNLDVLIVGARQPSWITEQADWILPITHPFEENDVCVHRNPELFVTEKKFKAKYAHEKAILIDDRPGCVEPFRQAGGRAILHSHPDDTISALKEHIEILL